MFKNILKILLLTHICALHVVRYTQTINTIMFYLRVHCFAGNNLINKEHLHRVQFNIGQFSVKANGDVLFTN